MSTYFPFIESKNLEGRKFELPRELKGMLNVVIMAFRREQQLLVDGWLAFLDDIVAKYRDVEYYELPTISRSFLLFRWMIDGGMRSGIPDKSSRERTITLYINKKPIKRQLNIPNEDTIYIFLIKRNEIIWRTDGAFTVQKGETLDKLIKDNLNL